MAEPGSGPGHPASSSWARPRRWRCIEHWLFLKVGINGSGRAGRLVLRAGFGNQSVTTVAVDAPFMDLVYMC